MNSIIYLYFIIFFRCFTWNAKRYSLLIIFIIENIRIYESLKTINSQIFYDYIFILNQNEANTFQLLNNLFSLKMFIFFIHLFLYKRVLNVLRLILDQVYKGHLFLKNLKLLNVNQLIINIFQNLRLNNQHSLNDVLLLSLIFVNKDD